MYKDGDGIHDVIYEAIECPQLTGSNGLLRVKINSCADRKMEIQLKNTRFVVDYIPPLTWLLNGYQCKLTKIQ